MKRGGGGGGEREKERKKRSTHIQTHALALVAFVLRPTTSDQRPSSPEEPTSTDFSDAVSSFSDTVDENTDPGSNVCSPVSDNFGRATQLRTSALPLAEKVKLNTMRNGLDSCRE